MGQNSIINNFKGIADENLPARGFRSRGYTGINSRRIAGVRYPWDGWGAPTYAKRSMRNKSITVTEEPSPTIKERSRQFLNLINSRRNVFEVAFPYRNTMKKWNKEYDEIFEHWWWNDGGIPHPTFTVQEGTVRSPVPMSGEANWLFEAGVEGGAGDGPQWLYRASLPNGDGWGSTEKWPRWYGTGMGENGQYVYTYNVKRKCTRICIYKDVGWNGLELNFDPTSPDYVGRHRRTQDDASRALVAEDGGNRAVEPWGWTDVTAPFFLRPAVSKTPLSYADQIFTPWKGGPPGEEYGGGGDDGFSRHDVSRLSISQINWMLQYGGRSWHQPLNMNLLPASDWVPGYLDTVDVVIEATFYKYAILARKIIDANNGEGQNGCPILQDEGYALDPETGDPIRGFGGAYGRLFIIY